ncbi:hypothetical protein CQ10_01165 [Bradyrhizobium valentinum]|nr:hypothetical protein CQ10_01165 [Bradyrhizobium valentinum]
MVHALTCERSASMAGLLLGCLRTQSLRLLVSRELFLLLCVGTSRGRAMGKFFLIIIAVSVAVLLAMSAYVISL